MTTLWEELEFDLGEDEGASSSPLNEGGSYHLKSALKTPSDYFNDYIFTREFKKLETLTGIGRDTTIEPFELTEFWRRLEVAGRQQTSSTLIREMSRDGLNTINLRSLMNYATAEIFTLDPNFPNKRDIIQQRLTAFFNNASTNLYYPIVEKTRVLQKILTLINNLKIIRTNQLGDFPGYASINIVNDCIRIHVYDDIVLYCSVDQIQFVTSDQTFWVPVSYFLNTCDKLQELMNILLYSNIMGCMEIPNVPTPENILSVYQWGIDLLQNEGNMGFDALASYEAICVGVILSRDDQELIKDPYGFLKGVLNDMGDLKTYGESLVEILSVHESETICDLHGLYRIWGHPVIDIDGGLEKLRSVSLKKKVVDEDISKDTGRMFKEIFYTNYYNKHGFFPSFKLLADTPEHSKKGYLLSCLSQGIHIDPEIVHYSLSDWDYVKSLKTFEIPVNWNIVQNAKDKAISPTRSEVCSMLSSKGSLFDPNSRRGILKLIHTPSFKMRDFLSNLNQFLTPDHLIIGFYPKERELKRLARFFSLMSFRLRLYFTSTEELIGEKLLPYFPQITMCLSLLDLHKKMSDLSEKAGPSGKDITFVINIDFSKWNSNMRYETCTHVFKEIDDLFGVEGLIDNSHLYLSSSTLYLSSGERKLLPDSHTGVTLDGKSSWTNDPSGKEGLRQKGWTIVTDTDIELVNRRHDCQAKLIGGGDNQVIVVTFRSRHTDEDGQLTDKGKQSVRGKLDDYLKDLAEHFEKRGLPLKIMETWASCSLFMYNKMMYINGTPLRSCLKQISRCFPFSNDSLMTVSTMVGTLMTTMKAAMMREKLPHGIVVFKWIILEWISRMIQLMHPICYILYGKLTSANYTEKRRGLISQQIHKEGDYGRIKRNIFGSIGLYPSVLGGPGAIMLPGLILRGFPDTFCEWHSCVMKMLEFKDLSPEVKFQLERALTVSFSNDINYSKLIEDPYSISHNAPVHGINTLRTKSRESLISMVGVENREFLQLVKLLDPKKEKEFADALCSGRKLDPRVLHEISKASLYGIANGLASRVDQTKTIRRLNETLDVVQIIADDEWNYLNYLGLRQSIVSDMNLQGCSTPIADELRLRSWGKPVLGCTVPHPYHYLSATRKIGLTTTGCTGISVRAHANSRTEMMSRRGKQQPYFGSYTREKFKTTDIAAAYGEEPLLSRAIRLLKLVNWRYPEGTDWARLLKAPLQMISDIDPNTLILAVEEIKGDFAHRFAGDSNTHGGIPNFLITPTSHFSVCTSTWHGHARGGINENIHFQACIIYCLISTMMDCLQESYHPDITYNFIEQCNNCIRTLDEPSPSDTQPLKDVPFERLENNTYAYCSSAELSFDWEFIVRMGRTGMIIKDTVMDANENLSVDAGDSSLGFLLFLTITGSFNVLTPSYCIMLRNRGGLDSIFGVMSRCFKICNKLGLGSDFKVRNTLPLELLMVNDTEMLNLESMTDQFGLQKLEGGLKFSNEEVNQFIENLLRITPTRFILNNCVPNLTLQMIVYQFWFNMSRLTCHHCLTRAKEVYFETTQRKEADGFLIHCQTCLNGQEPIKPLIVSIHPDFFIKSIKVPGVPPTNPPQRVKWIKVTPSISDIDEPRPYVGPLHTWREWNSVQNLDGMFRSIYEMRKYTNILMQNNLIVFAALIRQLRDIDDDFNIHVMVEELSDIETKTVFEQLHSLRKPPRFHVTLHTTHPALDFPLVIGISNYMNEHAQYVLGLKEVWEFQRTSENLCTCAAHIIKTKRRSHFGYILVDNMDYSVTDLNGLVYQLNKRSEKAMLEMSGLDFGRSINPTEKRWRRFVVNSYPLFVKIIRGVLKECIGTGLQYHAKKFYRTQGNNLVMLYASLLSHCDIPDSFNMKKIYKIRLDSNRQRIVPLLDKDRETEFGHKFHTMYNFYHHIVYLLDRRGAHVWRVPFHKIVNGVSMRLIDRRDFYYVNLDRYI